MADGFADSLSMTARLVATLARHWHAHVVETHISWVLLDGRHAWKFKKPVRLPFLDCTHLADRQRLCEVELQLNRRLAPDLYLDVLPITGTVDAPELSGPGAVIEYVLRMRQFPAEALMRTRLAQGRLQASELARLAQRLAAFHAQAPRAPSGSSYGSPERIVQTVDGVLAGLRTPGHDAAVIARLQTWMREQAALLTPLWLARQRAGRVVEGHGDLHLANLIVLDDVVTAFDCIEFDPALRWIDAMDDMAFTVMDLHAHARSDLAWHFLNAYLDASGDHAGLPVLRYYLVYRALVRAFVAGMPGAQDHAASVQAPAPDYLETALQLTRPGAVGMLITHGVSGSGKSHQALQIAMRAGAIRLRSDVERRRLPDWEDATRRYSPEASQATYARLLTLAGTVLDAGYPVIVDATFLRQAERAPFLQMARARGVPCHILHCEAPLAVLQQRIRQRLLQGDDPSQADETVLSQQLHAQDPLTPAEQALTMLDPANWPIPIPISTSVGMPP